MIHYLIMPFLNVVFYVVVFVLGLFILGKSGQFVVTAITRLGHHLQLSQFVTGFIILGVATSTPEIFVGLSSALAGTPQLSLGNLLGANIVLLTLVAGLTAILNRGVTIKQELSHPGRLGQIALLILTPLILLLDAHLSRLDAGFLAVLYLGYLIYVWRLRPKSSPPLESQLLALRVWHTAFLCLAGFLGLVLSAKAVVLASVNLAALLALPPVVIGTLFLSIGTNLPEMAVVVAAIRRHHPNLVIGDILGSASTNTLVMALVAFLSPFRIHQWAIFQTTAIFLGLALAAFFIMTRSKNRLSVGEGIVLLALYFGFVVSEIISLLFLAR